MFSLLLYLHQRPSDGLTGQFAIGARSTERDVGRVLCGPRVPQQVVAMRVQQHATVAAASVADIAKHRRQPTYNT